jgi:hypothetical protein
MDLVVLQKTIKEEKLKIDGTESDITVATLVDFCGDFIEVASPWSASKINASYDTKLSTLAE